MNRAFLPFLLLISMAWCQTSIAQITLDSTTLVERTVVDNLDIPWEIKWGPDDWLWLTERIGRVVRVNPEDGSKVVVLDLTAQVYQQSESGMLGMEIHPNFTITPHVFLAYTYLDGNNILERIVRYEYDGTNLINEVVLLDGIVAGPTHNGCRLLILPDNTMLITTGDAQDQPISQNTTAVNGKTLRINLDGTIPPDNPIAGSAVWSWGHRNAQGLLLAPNGKVYSSEHGPQTDDELNIIVKGGNYGWPTVHGFCDSPNETQFCADSNVIEPLMAWTPTIATSDILWYNHEAIPEWKGTILLTVLKDQMLVKIDLDGSGDMVINSDELFQYKWGRLRDLVQAPDGRVFLATSGTSWTNTSPGTHKIIELKNPNYVGIPTFNAFTKESIRVMPNPVDTHTTMVFSRDLIGRQFELVDVLGKIVEKTTIDNEKYLWSKADLPSGTYFIRVKGEEFYATQKLIVR